MISASALSKSFGAQVLFTDVSFQLNPGERYGLVGANGSGKTTLLNILAGLEAPSDGAVSLPRRAKLGVLRQDQFIYEEESILGVTMMGNQELWQAMSEKESLLAEDPESFDAERFSELEEIVQRHDGYAAEARAAEILEGLGLPTELHHQPLSTLSGGCSANGPPQARSGSRRRSGRKSAPTPSRGLSLRAGATPVRSCRWRRCGWWRCRAACSTSPRCLSMTSPSRSR